VLQLGFIASIGRLTISLSGATYSDMTIKIEKSADTPSSTAGGHVPRDTGQAMLRGAKHTCPQCGDGALYRKYLKVADHCSNCGEALHHQRADDAPPYFTIFIVGHVILAGVLAMEQAYRPSPWLHVAIWLPLTLILSLTMLPRIKGAMVGLQWALRMHGFGHEPDAVPSSDGPVRTPTLS
jgi:uncharacterized protein (DUF983 family)